MLSFMFRTFALADTRRRSELMRSCEQARLLEPKQRLWRENVEVPGISSL